MRLASLVSLLACLVAALPLPAADIVLTPPVGGGVSVTNAAGSATRLRVGDDGAVTLPGVAAAAATARGMCIEVATGRLGTCNAFTQGGNAFGAEASFGTTDNQGLSFVANGSAALRIIPGASGPVLIGGHPANQVAPGAVAAVIAGGGLAGTAEPTFGMNCGTTCGNRAGDVGATVGGGVANRASGGPGFGYATVSGGFGNVASGPSSSVAGGKLNSATGDGAGVGGGETNLASGLRSAIGGGFGHTASGAYSVVSGGASSTARGDYTFVGGGDFNIASGRYSTIPGGFGNQAVGDFSFAAGRGAVTQGENFAHHDGAFVWGDNDVNFFRSTAANEFSARARGGVRFVTAIDAAGAPARTFRIAPNGSVTIPVDSFTTNLTLSSSLAGDYARLSMVAAGQNNWDVAAGGPNNVLSFFRAGTGDVMVLQPGNPTDLLTMLNGARLTAGGAWTNASDRNAKSGFDAVDVSAVLREVAALPISTWRYRSEGRDVRHIGPMAQDFRRAFGFGDSDRTISTVDADGVALAAIQGLHQAHAELSRTVAEKDARIGVLERELAAIKRQLGL